MFFLGQFRCFLRREKLDEGELSSFLDPFYGVVPFFDGSDLILPDIVIRYTRSIINLTLRNIC